MSSLMVCHDLHIMMLEFAVEELFAPDSSVFDRVTLRKTTVMFRIIGNNWIELRPQLKNHHKYNGTNQEIELFHGGKSVVFSLTETQLKEKTSNANIKIHVYKEISKYFDVDPCYDAGLTYVDIHSLFNGIVKELSERKSMTNYTYYHEREPISKSMKGTFTLVNRRNYEKSGTIRLYIRLSYFGRSVITEFDRYPVGKFNVCEEMYEGYPYQCLELSQMELESGHWGRGEIPPPLNQRDIICECSRTTRTTNESGKNRSDSLRDSTDVESIHPRDIGRVRDTGGSAAVLTDKFDDAARERRKIGTNLAENSKDSTTDTEKEINRKRQRQRKVQRPGEIETDDSSDSLVKIKQLRSEKRRQRDTLDDEFDRGGVKRGKYRRIMEKSPDKSNGEQRDVIEDKTRGSRRILDSADMRKRDYLRGMATGGVTIGLDESLPGSGAKFSTSICCTSKSRMVRCSCASCCQVNARCSLIYGYLDC